VDPRAGLDALLKEILFLPLPGIKPVFKPVASSLSELPRFQDHTQVYQYYMKHVVATHQSVLRTEIDN